MGLNHVSAYFGSHFLFLAAAIGTHALAGYTLGAALFDAPRAGLLGGIAADFDLLFPAAWEHPLVHRGITHTALALGVTVAVAAARGRSVAGGVGVGYASQLLIDATTPMGIPLAYPLVTTHVGITLNGHSPAATAVLWTCCLGWLWWHQQLPVVGD